MRHRIKDVRLSRDTNHRKSLIANLLRSLILEGTVTTTRAKARVLKQLMDKLITKARVDTIANRRLVHRTFGKRDVVNTLFERIAPIMTDRTSGFTTNSVVGTRRGDASDLIKISFLTLPEITGTLKNPNKKVAVVAKIKPAAKATPKVVKESAPEPKEVASKTAAAQKTVTKKAAPKKAALTKKVALKKATQE